MARPRARCIAASSASSRSRTTTNARCAGRSTLTPGATRDAPGAAGPSRRRRRSLCTRPRGRATAAGTGAEPHVNGVLRPFTRSRRAAIGCAFSTRRMRARSGSHSAATTERRCRSISIGTDGGLLERAVRCDERVAVARPSASISLVDFAAVEPGRIRRAGKPRLRCRCTRTCAVAAQRSPATRMAHRAAASGMRWPTARRSRSCSFGCAARRAPATAAARIACRGLPPMPAAERATSVRCGSDSRRAAGASTIACTIPAATPIDVARGASETWLLRNYYTSAPHAMHLHGFQFRVVERETSPEAARAARDRRARTACDRSGLQGHGARLARRIGAHRDRLPHAVRGVADLPRPLPQPRARGRRDDAAGQGRLMAGPRRILLVGGGHSHVEVLRRFAPRPIRASRSTLVVARRPDVVFRHAARARRGPLHAARNRTSQLIAARGVRGRALRRAIAWPRLDLSARPAALAARRARVVRHRVPRRRLDARRRACRAPATLALARQAGRDLPRGVGSQMQAEARAGDAARRSPSSAAARAASRSCSRCRRRLTAESGARRAALRAVTDQHAILPQHAGDRARALRPHPRGARCRSALSSARDREWSRGRSCG